MDFVELITSSREYLDYFTYGNYPACFSEFTVKAAPLFASIDDPEQAAAECFEKMQEYYKTLSKRDLKELPFLDKQVLALFLSPACFKQGEKTGVFAKKLAELWNAAYPKNRYIPGIYDEIIDGFEINILGIAMRRPKNQDQH